VADAPFSSSSVPAGQLRQFDFQLTDATPGFYRVVPYDAETTGIPSDSVELQLPPGPAVWSMFGLDPTHNRRSPYVGAQTPTVKWRFRTTGPGFAPYDATIAEDGTVYVGIGLEVHAISPDGTRKWQYTTGSIIVSAPTIGPNGTIYVGGYDRYLYAFNPDGTRQWKFDAGSEVEASPAVGADGTVYLACNTGLYAITPDGAGEWFYPVGYGVCSSPAVGADGTVYLGSVGDNKVYEMVLHHWRFRKILACNRS
jgi:outer membrane protein assembly factor BamB